MATKILNMVGEQVKQPNLEKILREQPEEALNLIKNIAGMANSNAKTFGEVIDHFLSEKAQLKSERDELKERLGEYEAKEEQYQKRIEALERKALIDTTTGVYNKNFFNERLKPEIKKAERHANDLSLIMYDIDYFKKVNDTYGHPTGDYTLREVAQKIKSLIREEDLLARYGGEEFVVILPQTTKEATVNLAERIREEIEHMNFVYEDKKINVTVSGGVAEYQKGETPEDLIRKTDKALYDAKKAGRNRIVTFE